MVNETNTLEALRNTNISISSAEGLIKRYNSSIQKYNPVAKNILEISTSSTATDSFAIEEICESNPFIATQITKNRMTIATPAQLMLAAQTNPNFFKGKYFDIGLVLKENGDNIDENDYISRNLYGQVKERGLIATPNTPVRISLNGLKLKEDRNSFYGLVFDLADAETIIVPEFAHTNNTKTFNEVDERGVPIFEESGQQRFYSRNSGLVRLCLDRELNLRASESNLGSSSYHGRVPLIIRQ